MGLAFSPDGQTLVSGDWSGNIFWWDNNGILTKTTKEHRNAVATLKFSANGQILISGSWDGTIKFWNQTGALIRSIDAHDSGTLDLTLSEDGKYLISGGEDDTVRMWQRSPEFLTPLWGHGTSVWGVAMVTSHQDTPENSTPTIVSSGSDGVVNFWDRQGNLLRSLPSSRGEAWAVAIHPDGDHLVVAHNDGSLVMGTMEGEIITTIPAHSDAVFDVAFSPVCGDKQPCKPKENGAVETATIASVSWDGTVKLWDSNGNALQTLMQGKPEDGGAVLQLNGVSFSGDNRWLAAVGTEGLVHLWQRDSTGQFADPPQQSFNGHKDVVWDVAFSPDSQILATASEDNTIKLWTLDGTLIETLTGHGDRVDGLTFIPPNSGLPEEWGTVLVSAAWDHTVKLWRLDGTLLTTLEGHRERVLDVAFYPASSDHGPLLASASLDRSVLLWELDQVLMQEQIVGHGCDWLKSYVAPQPDVLEQIKICTE